MTGKVNGGIDSGHFTTCSCWSLHQLQGLVLLQNCKQQFYWIFVSSSKPKSWPYSTAAKLHAHQSLTKHSTDRRAKLKALFYTIRKETTRKSTESHTVPLPDTLPSSPKLLQTIQCGDWTLLVCKNERRTDWLVHVCW